MAVIVMGMAMKRTLLLGLFGFWSLLALAEGDSVPVVSGGVEVCPPVSRLTDTVLYQFLLAEIAAQRGDFRLASEAGLALAQKTRDARLARRATEFATHARETARSIKAARLWVDLDPLAERSQQTLILLLAGNGDLAQAKQRAAAYLANSGRPVAETFPALAGLFARSSDRKAALDVLGDLAAIYATIPEAQMTVARAAWNAGLYERADKAALAALRLKPDWEDVALLRGQIIERSDIEAMLSFWTSFLEQYPQARSVRLAYARALVREGRVEQAREVYARLVQEADEGPDYYQDLGMLAVQIHDLAGAEQYFNRALERGYSEPEKIQMALGQLLEGQRRYEEAVQWYRQAAGSGVMPEALVKAAIVLGKLKRSSEGRALLKMLEPVDVAERVALVQAEAQILREAGEMPAALAVLDRGVAALPDQVDLLYDRAMLEEDLKKIDAMERDLRQIIKLKPDHAHAYNALGYALLEHTTRVSDALSLLEKAMKLLPNDPYIMDSMGWALYKAGRKTEAASHLRRAYKMMPDAEVAAHLGEVLWHLGAREEARQIWEGSLKAHPGNARLRDVLGRYRP